MGDLRGLTELLGDHGRQELLWSWVKDFDLIGGNGKRKQMTKGVLRKQKDLRKM